MNTTTAQASDDAKTGGRGKDFTAATSVVAGHTKGGKEISIGRGNYGRMFVINVAGGGTKPPELDGSFTNFDNAKHAIKFYVDTHVGEIELVDTNDRSAVPMVSETEEFPDAIPE